MNPTQRHLLALLFDRGDAVVIGETEVEFPAVSRGHAMSNQLPTKLSLAGIMLQLEKVIARQAPMQITEADKKRMKSKPRQLVRFVVLNLKILKAVDRTKRS